MLSPIRHGLGAMAQVAGVAMTIKHCALGPFLGPPPSVDTVPAGSTEVDILNPRIGLVPPFTSGGRGVIEHRVFKKREHDNDSQVTEGHGDERPDDRVSP